MHGSDRFVCTSVGDDAHVSTAGLGHIQRLVGSTDQVFGSRLRNRIVATDADTDRHHPSGLSLCSRPLASTALRIFSASKNAPT